MKPNVTFDNVLVVAFAAIFSLATLWMIDSWIKYPLFIVEILAIVTIYLVCTKYELKSTLSGFNFNNVKFSLIIDAVLVLASIALFAFNTAFNTGSTTQVALSILVTSILPGYALLSISKLDTHFSKLEKIVLSFILSYAFTGFLSLIFLTTNGTLKTALFTISYVVIALLSAFRHHKQAPYQSPASLSRSFDIFPLLLVVGLYAFSFLVIYPNFALIPGTDVSQHFGRSVLLNRAPDFYIGSTYLFAHLHESSFIYLANSSLANTQTGLITLNLMLPLAFYIMAKPYLEKIDSRLPSLATIFWVLLTNSFGGFSWLYYSVLKITNPFEPQLTLLSITAEKTYNGTVYGVLGLWFVPATVSLVLLMTALFLLSKKDVPTFKFLALFSIVIAVLYLTHVAEAVIVVAFIALYAIITKSHSLKLRDSILASLIGFALAAVVYAFFSQVTPRFILNTTLLASLLLPSFLLMLSLVVNRYTPKLSLKLNLKRPKFPPKIFATAITVAYLTISLSLLYFTDSFHTSQVNDLGIVPLFIYPLMLGVTGFLSVISLYHISKNTVNYKPLKLFLIFTAFVFIAGVIVSLSNLYFFDVNFWEKRFVWLIKIPLALFAPIPVLLLIGKLQKESLLRRRLKIIASVALIGTICLCGISTVFLNFEYWNLYTQKSDNYLTSAQLDAVDNFKKILDNDPRAWAITCTSESLATMAFVEPADTLQLQQLLYNIHTRELAFTELYRSSTFSHPYSYIDARDAALLNNSYSGQFLATYLPTVPVVFQNEQVTIYNVSKLSYPQLSSENALIVPFNNLAGSKINLAYDILSLGFYNYTVVYDLDQNALSYPTAILSFDPPATNNNSDTANLTSARPVDDYLNYLNSGGTLIVLNTNVQAGFFAQQLFSVSNLTITAQKISGSANQDLPFEVPVPIITAKDGDVTASSQYESVNGSSPLIMQKNYSNGGQLVYVNLYPLLFTIQTCTNQSSFNSVLSHLLDGVGLTKMESSKPLGKIDGYMGGVYLETNTQIESSAVIFPQNLLVDWVRVKVGDSNYSFSNVTGIKISDYSQVSIQSHSASVRNGTGFYTQIEFPAFFQVTPANTQFTVEIICRNGTYTYHDAGQLSVESQYGLELFARTPTLSAYAADFTELYLNQYNAEISGQNLQTSGLTKFTVNIADNYQAVGNLTLGDYYQNNVLAGSYDYLYVILSEALLFVVAAPVFAIAIYVFNKSRNRPQTEQTDS